MKVKIGKYVSRKITNLHRDWMDRKYDGKQFYKDFKPDRVDVFVEKLDDALQWFYNHTINVVLDRMEQTVKVRIDPWDTWSMDATLRPIILPMLKQLQQQKQGAPNVDYEDVPEELRPTAEEIELYKKNGETDPNFFKRWDWVIDEMIFAFENLDGEWEDQFTSGEIDIDWEPCDDDRKIQMYQMVHGPNHTYKADYEGMAKYQKRIDNGLLLFGKYFRALWT